MAVNTDALLQLFPALRSAPVLKRLTDRHLHGLLGVLSRLDLAAGETLFVQGFTGDAMAIIGKGRFDVAVNTSGGRQKKVSELGPGDVVGEMASLDPAPRSATVTAATSATVFLLNRAMLKALQTKGPAVARCLVGGIIDQVTHRIRALDEDVVREEGRLASDQTASRLRLDRPFPEADLVRSKPLGQTVDVNRIAALDGFDQVGRETLVAVSRHLLYPAGSLLCREGDVGSSCFIVLSGEIGVYKQVKGRPQSLAVLSECLLGQMSLVDSSPRSATLRADSDVAALEFSRDTYEQLLGEHSPVALQFQESLAVAGIRQLRKATERWADVARREEEARKAHAQRLQQEALKPTMPAPAKESVSQARLEREMAVTRAALRERRTERTPAPRNHLESTSEVETAREQRRKLEQIRPRSQKQAKRHTIAYMQASLKEWGMSLEDLDDIHVSRPDGIMSAAERKARQRTT